MSSFDILIPNAFHSNDNDASHSVDVLYRVAQKIKPQ